MKKRHVLAAVILTAAAVAALRQRSTTPPVARDGSTAPTAGATPTSREVPATPRFAARNATRPDEPAPPATVDADADAPPRDLTAAEKTEILRDRLESSGRSNEPWMARVPEMLSTWLDAQPAEIAATVEIGAPDCWRDGCAFVATYTDPAAYAELGTALASSPDFRAWKGWRFRSPPETDAAGRVFVTWYLMGPEAGS